MSKRKNENTLDQDVQVVEDKSTQLKQIKQLEESNLKNSISHDQDSNSKGNNDSINEQNKGALDNATLSQSDNKPFNDISQRIALKIDHSKALEIFNRLNETDREGYIKEAHEAIIDAPGNYTLTSLMRSYAVEYRGFNNENIVKYFEGLYMALNNNNLSDNESNPGHLDADMLFNKLILELVDVASYYEKQDLINYIYDIYQIEAIGNISESIDI